MRCIQVQNHAERYSDGDIDAAMRAAIDNHLTGCERCRAAYNSMAAMRSLFSETTVPKSPSNLQNALQEAVHTHDRSRYTGAKKLHMPGWWVAAFPGVRIAYSLVLVILTAAGIYMGYDLWESNEQSNSMPAAASEYPGSSAFTVMQPGSVEQTYFMLTSYEPNRGVK